MRLIAKQFVDKGIPPECYSVEDLGRGYVVIEGNEVGLLKERVKTVEPDFKMTLGKEQLLGKEILGHSGIMIVTIGEKQNHPEVDIHCSMKSKDLGKNMSHIKEINWISCYSEQVCLASDLIKTVDVVLKKAKHIGKKVIFYLDGKPEEKYFWHHNLAYECINSMLGKDDLWLQKIPQEELAGCYEVVNGQYRLYYEHFVYGQSFEVLLEEALGRMNTSNPTFKNYEKEREESFSPWAFPVATEISLKKGNHNSFRQKCVPKGPMPYKGKEVYIGIVTTETIDWTDSYLMDERNQTRVQCIWEQQEEEQGIYYTGHKLNEAFKQGKYLPQINKGAATKWLALAGGREKEYKALGCEAEFLVAHIKTASKKIQQFYTSTMNPSMVLVSDILIGARKLIELAKINEKPLVLYLPYHYLWARTLGNNRYDALLNQLSYERGVTLIVPAGEEADQGHCQMVKGSGPQEVLIRGAKGEEILCGMIFSQVAEKFKAKLMPIGREDESISLEKKGRYGILGGFIETTGLEWEEISGQMILKFRIFQSPYQDWRLILEGQENKNIHLTVNLLEGKDGPSPTLSPSCAMDTINPAPYKWSAIGVGSFDLENLVVSSSSGRTSEKNVAYLECVAEGRTYFKDDNKNQNILLEGTGVATSRIAGAIATLYSKWYAEKQKDFPNTPMMKKWLEHQLKELPGQPYPNLSQGKGILDLEKLRATLIVPL